MREATTAPAITITTVGSVPATSPAHVPADPIPTLAITHTGNRTSWGCGPHALSVRHHLFCRGWAAGCGSGVECYDETTGRARNTGGGGGGGRAGGGRGGGAGGDSGEGAGGDGGKGEVRCVALLEGRGARWRECGRAPPRCHHQLYHTPASCHSPGVSSCPWHALLLSPPSLSLFFSPLPLSSFSSLSLIFSLNFSCAITVPLSAPPVYADLGVALGCDT